jgi:alanine racemase
MATTEARIDLDAIRSNVAELRRRAGMAGVMAVVKADGYGHGMIPAATAALEAGATWLGVAMADEALALRRAGITAPTLAWLLGPHDDWDAVVAAGVDVGVSAQWGLERAVAAAALTGRPSCVHLKVDSGLGRAGAPTVDWPDLVDAAAKASAEGTVDVVGVWSHLAYADEPGHPTVDRQREVFEAALDVARRAGLNPALRHLANSAATLSRPDLHYDLVRPGIAVYGLSPGPEVGTAGGLGLTPAMTFHTQLALVKRAPKGHGVSYGHRYTTETETSLGLVPVGYADGVPRHLTNIGEVGLHGRRYRIAGTVCMDQFVIDLGSDEARAGDEVVLFGSGRDGAPTADEWAHTLGTINYEIVTRIGSRVPRRYDGQR